jgi:XRE family aerobic/anaerobic benzoate catabolism transcriptional regulator
LGLPIEQLRKERGLSRAALAARLDMSERHLYRLERGFTPIRRMHLLAVAEALDVSPADLAGDFASSEEAA